jgi:hypothetical protein
MGEADAQSDTVSRRRSSPLAAAASALGSRVFTYLSCSDSALTCASQPARAPRRPAAKQV